jgi:sulfur carrier protein ThiS
MHDIGEKVVDGMSVEDACKTVGLNNEGQVVGVNTDVYREWLEKDWNSI